MTAKAHADVTDILSAVDFSPYETVADIGGGFGHLLRAITEHHPHIRGILFDLPHVLTQVAPAPRIELHPGDFFVEPLPSTDLSIVMHVIHDWDDVAAATIFSAIAATAKPGAHLMVFEWVLGEQPTEDDANVMDVLMLTGPGGRERTAAEYTALLTRAGFETTAVRRIAGPMHVIEAHKTSS